MTKNLRVVHFPQVPCKPFIVEVDTLFEARLLFDALADYDLFQYVNNIKPDYSNATVLEKFDEEENEWISWSDENTGNDDLHEFLEEIEQERRKEINNLF